MIADCETCDRKQVPCKSCQESQRAICFICQGDSDPDPYGERMPTIYREVWRRRIHQEMKGYTARHDDKHTDGSIADAAACYASPNAPVRLWPWKSAPLPNHTDRKERLIDAAALCIAEIERLDRV